MALYDALTGLANRAFFHEQFQHTVSIRKEPHSADGAAVHRPQRLQERQRPLGPRRRRRSCSRRSARGIQEHAARRRLGCAARRRRVRDRDPVDRRACRGGPASPSVCSRRSARRSSSSARQLSIDASIGISVGDEAEVMLQEADAAMYRAKRQQDVGYAFFDPDLDIAAVQRSRRVIELREAVELGQFTLDYQPVIDLEAYEIAGYEALLRWQHPTEGADRAARVHPARRGVGTDRPARQVGARGGVPLRRDAAARTWAARSGWRSTSRRGSCSIPTSSVHVEEALADVRLPAALPDARADRERPARVRRRTPSSGCRAQGERGSRSRSTTSAPATRRSRTCSASRRHREDRPELHRHDRRGTADLVLLKGIVDLGNALGLNLVAEGIQTPAQHEIVRGLGCHSAQGFYFGHPAPDALRRLADRPPVAVTAI